MTQMKRGCVPSQPHVHPPEEISLVRLMQFPARFVPAHSCRYAVRHLRGHLMGDFRRHLVRDLRGDFVGNLAVRRLG